MGRAERPERGGPAARFTDFTPIPVSPAPTPLDTSCIGKSRAGGCVLSFQSKETDDLSDLFFADGGRRPPLPRLSVRGQSERFELKFDGGSCAGSSIRGDAGCWVQVDHVYVRTAEHDAIMSVQSAPEFARCGASLELCDSTFRCDCTPRPPPPPGFEAMATDGGERTGNTKPKRRL
jgi:hypothetical protein